MHVRKSNTNQEGAGQARDTMKPSMNCGTAIPDDVLLHLFQFTRESLPALPAPGRIERLGTRELPDASHEDLPRESLCRLTSPLLAPKGIRPWEFEIPALPPGKSERAKKPTRH